MTSQGRGARYRAARIKAGFTVPKAAKALGVSDRTLQRWETEKYEASVDVVGNMARLYKTTTDALIRGTARAAAA